MHRMTCGAALTDGLVFEDERAPLRRVALSTGVPFRCQRSSSAFHRRARMRVVTIAATERDTCGQCHAAQRGPFVFEHEAVREGCTTCHAVHGSINAKLLTQRNHTLCLKCHMQQQTAPGSIVIGGLDHTRFVSRGTCWSAGCHEAVHGSQIGSSLRY